MKQAAPFLYVNHLAVVLHVFIWNSIVRSTLNRKRIDRDMLLQRSIFLSWKWDLQLSVVSWMFP